MKWKIVKKESDFSPETDRNEFVSFIHRYLDNFTDPEPAIDRSLDYAFSHAEGKGGFALALFDENGLVGALVMNKTGMGEYIPENILVYLAVRADQRGKGIGRSVVDYALEMVDGDVALHVEYDNPAKRLYERIGFVSKYAEMRFIR